MNRKRNRRYRGWTIRVGKRRGLLHTSDFSDVENSSVGVEEIQNLASQAGLAAASEAKAVGIPRVFARDNMIVREHADGLVEILTEGQSEKEYFTHFKLGTLHARKK